jgi:plastocyanin
LNRLFVTLAAVAAVLVVALPASARSQVQVTIRHEVHGCHAWAVGSGAFAASHSIHAARGTVIVVKNTDVMPHRLVELAGPAVTFTNMPSASTMMGLKGPFAPGMMGRMNSATKVTLTKPGTYRFTTKAGEDYMAGVKTIGEDNVLKLTVVVS